MSCSSTALNFKESSLHSHKSVLCHITVPPSSLTRTDQILDRLMQGRRKGKVGSVSWAVDTIHSNWKNGRTMNGTKGKLRIVRFVSISIGGMSLSLFFELDVRRRSWWRGFFFEGENRFLANLPALRTAKESYWTDQIQPFIDSFAERDLSSTKERGEITKRWAKKLSKTFFSRNADRFVISWLHRRMLATGITRIIGSYLSTSIRPIGPSAPARPSTRTMHRVDLLVPGTMESMAKLLFPQQAQPEYNAWVSVVEEKQRGDIWVSFLPMMSVIVCLADHERSSRPSASYLEYW